MAWRHYRPSRPAGRDRPGQVAYTPLPPTLVDENWFSASQVAYLGAANLAGYLAGAVLVLALNLLLGTKSLEPQNCFAQAVDFSHHFIATSIQTV